jgi:hypothetical protein
VWWIPLVSLGVTVLVVVVGAAVGYGVLRANLANVERTVTRLEGEVRESVRAQEASRDKLGARVGDVERWLERVSTETELSRPYRLPPARGPG